MKIMYQGKEIEVEDIDPQAESLDILTPVNIPEEQEELNDTMELTEEDLKKIRESIGEEHE